MTALKKARIVGIGLKNILVEQVLESVTVVVLTTSRLNHLSSLQLLLLRPQHQLPNHCPLMLLVGRSCGRFIQLKSLSEQHVARCNHPGLEGHSGDGQKYPAPRGAGEDLGHGCLYSLRRTSMIVMHHVFFLPDLVPFLLFLFFFF